MKITRGYLEVGDDLVLKIARRLHSLGEITNEELDAMEAIAIVKQAKNDWVETEVVEITIDTEKYHD